MHFFQEGGPVFMYTLLILLLLSIGLFIQGLMKTEKLAKNKELLSSIGLFALVFGFLGQVLGLITAFDAIEAMGNVSPGILSEGLKISFLTTGFGAFVFLMTRLGIIVFTFIKK
jgi:flagellar motor component MotA